MVAAAAAVALCFGLSLRSGLGGAKAKAAAFVGPLSSASARRRPRLPCAWRTRGLRRGRALRVELEDTAEYKAFAERHLVDEAALSGSSPFPIPEGELIKLTKRFLATEAPEATTFGKGAMMTDDFRFLGPVIGPLDKEEFMATRDDVDFFVSFPDATAQFHHFRVDPFEPSRVWWTARGTGTHTGEAVSGSTGSALFGPPSGRGFKNPPQACSLKFTPEGKVQQFTIGYVMDRSIGNTGGLGGFFGVLHAMGKNPPFEEASAWAPSWGYRLYVQVGRLFGRLRLLTAKTDEERYKLEKGMIKMPAASDELD